MDFGTVRLWLPCHQLPCCGSSGLPPLLRGAKTRPGDNEAESLTTSTSVINAGPESTPQPHHPALGAGAGATPLTPLCLQLWSQGWMCQHHARTHPPRDRDPWTEDRERSGEGQCPFQRPAPRPGLLWTPHEAAPPFPR